MEKQYITIDINQLNDTELEAIAEIIYNHDRDHKTLKKIWDRIAFLKW